MKLLNRLHEYKKDGKDGVVIEAYVKNEDGSVQKVGIMAGFNFDEASSEQIIETYAHCVMAVNTQRLVWTDEGSYSCESIYNLVLTPYEDVKHEEESED